MCAISMITDHYIDKWGEINKQNLPYILPNVLQPKITPEEINEFHRLLDRAREYDKKHNQPDCELEEKKQKLIKLSEELGIKISFGETV